MKALKLFFLLNLFLLLNSCEIIQETRFEPDGGGTYSLNIDLSKLNEEGDFGNTYEKQIDTLIVFSEFIKEHEDSIQQLSLKQQKELEVLENFSFAVKSDSVEKEMYVKIIYDFDNINELKTIKERINNLQDSNTSMGYGMFKDDGEINGFYQLYNTTFNRKYFSLKSTPDALAKAEELKKDSTLIEENPLAGVISFKSRLIFPYKIKNVDNKNATLLSDSMGVELKSDVLKIRTDPSYFNLNITFE